MLHASIPKDLGTRLIIPLKSGVGPGIIPYYWGGGGFEDKAMIIVNRSLHAPLASR